MRKTVMILAAVLGFSLAACSQGNNKKENNKYNQYNAIQGVFTAEQQLY